MLNPPRKPRVFIVSSTETHLVSEVIKNCLKRHAEVVPWYLDSVWKHGDFILQVLLEQAPKYDFAVIIFAQDDKTISRGNEAYAPRDNVIFEAGLFMAHLGHKRTFIVTPREQNLKILSDLAGLVLLSYDEPTPTSGLEGALKPVCDKICTEIKQQKIRCPEIAARPGPGSFGDTHSQINQLLTQRRESRKPVSVLNIALDMEFTWGLILRDHVMKYDWPGGLIWRSLMMDSTAADEMRTTSDVASIATAMNREEEINKYCREHEADLKRQKIQFECRAYASIPSMHGFAIGKQLHVGICRSENGKLACAPYLSFSSEREDIALDAEIAEQYISVFNNWFEQNWQTGRRIYPK